MQTLLIMHSKWSPLLQIDISLINNIVVVLKLIGLEDNFQLHEDE